MKFIEKYKNEGILGLSMRQPYAEMMLHGKVETREWNTDYRGWVLICAAKTEYTYPEVKQMSGKYAQHIEDIMRGRNVVLGQAIAIGRLIDTKELVKDGGDYPRTFVDVNANEKKLYGFFFEDVVRIKPFAVTGKLSLFALNAEIVEQIEFL